MRGHIFIISHSVYFVTISTQGEIGLIPERQLRYIGQIPHERWSSAWNEVIATAPPGGVRTTHVEKIVARIKSELTPAQKSETAANQNVINADQDFVLGKWEKERTRNGNTTWDGLIGPVTRVEQHEITVLARCWEVEALTLLSRWVSQGPAS